MARLPIPGSDKGSWGTILNDFLLQSLEVDGRIRSGSVGNSQIVGGAIAKAKLAAPVQASLDKADVAADSSTVLSRANNLSELTSVSTARNNLGLGGAAIMSPNDLAGSLAFTATYTKRLTTVLPRLNQALPAVHPNPPSVSYSGANTASSITNSKRWVLNGGNVHLGGAQAFSAQGVDQNGSQYLAGSCQTGNEYPAWFFSFITDAPMIELVYQGNVSPSYRLLVDGYCVSQDLVVAGGATSGQQHRLLVIFGDRRLREIIVESGTFFCSAIVTSVIDTVLPASARRKIGFMGDSIMQNGGINSIAPTASKLIGCEPVLNASGGTGFINSQGGVGGKQIFLDRLPSLLAVGLDYLVTCGGANDSTTGLDIAVTTYATLAKQALSPDRIFFTGPWVGPANVSSAAAKRDIIKSAAESSGCVFIDNVAESWINGTGNVSAPAGDGNADVYVSADNIHPLANAGYTYLGARLGLSLAGRIGI